LSIFDPVRLLQCPNCNETIDALSQQCRFCLAPIDPVAAQAAADVMSKVNQACSDASVLRTTAVAIPIFFGVRFIPFFGMLGLVGFYGLVIGVPALSLRWWIRFGRITSNDPDFTRAKRTVLIVAILTSILLLFMLLWLIAIFAALRR
jgi:hypothetical protein